MKNFSTIGFSVVALVGCASTAALGEPPYLATYKPLQPPTGGVIVQSTAGLDGRLDVVGGCFVIIADSGAPVTVAFQPQVQVTRSAGRYGLVDVQTGKRAFPGDSIGVSGAPAADAQRFAAERLVSPLPAGCPAALFISNSTFGDR